MVAEQLHDAALVVLRERVVHADRAKAAIAVALMGAVPAVCVCVICGVVSEFRVCNRCALAGIPGAHPHKALPIAWAGVSQRYGVLYSTTYGGADVAVAMMVHGLLRPL